MTSIIAAHGQDSGRTHPKYLTLRILEACNADCFMCEFARSNDRYRFTVDEMARMLPGAWAAGVRVVRFTGGEPLMHHDILRLTQLGTEHGMAMSLITNGLLLPRLVDDLCASGLKQVIVSLDGASSVTHDAFRNLPGSWENGISGLERAKELGIHTRVNTVVGPHNYGEMPLLQKILADLGVESWELSAIKLARKIWYPDREDVLRVCDPIYEGGGLRPLGKRFYGDTQQENEAFFERSLPPGASGPECLVAKDYIFLDGRHGEAFACSCLPHRPDGPLGVPILANSGYNFMSVSFRDHAEFFQARGPLICNGCSATAAGYTEDIRSLPIASFSAL